MLFDEPSKKPLPDDPQLEDCAKRIVKSAISSVPMVGEALAEFISEPLAQRREDWLNDLAIRLGELERRVDSFHLDALRDNEQFVSAVLQATQVALKTHQKEKLEAFRSGVLNVALGSAGDDNVQTVFFTLLDRFTALHLRLLKAFRVPHPNAADREYLSWKVQGIPSYGARPRTQMELSRWVLDFVPGFSSTPEPLIKSLVNDLFTSGMVTVSADTDDLPKGLSSWTTSLGNDFLVFVESPTHK